MNQATYLYPICDVSLPKYNIGYIYILVSIKGLNFTHIGKKRSIRNRIQQHNSGVAYVSTEPLHPQEL